MKAGYSKIVFLTGAGTDQTQGKFLNISLYVSNHYQQNTIANGKQDLANIHGRSEVTIQD